MAAAPYPAYGRCYCELKSPILYPWLLKLSVTGATKPHSAVAPVSGSATGDFDLRREPDRSAGDRSRPAHSRRRFHLRSASWCW
ncbi:hypothetical protein D3X40_04695 [Klebsiella quasipneumoniae]|nr:hypothetical protein D3X40_04695 [Klebsiella quasipneumoniae]